MSVVYGLHPGFCNPARRGEAGSSCDCMSGSGGSWQSWNTQRSWSHWWGGRPPLCLLALLFSINWDLKTAPPPTLYWRAQSVAPHANSSMDKIFASGSVSLSSTTAAPQKPWNHIQGNHSGIDPFSFSFGSSCQQIIYIYDVCVCSFAPSCPSADLSPFFSTQPAISISVPPYGPGPI